MRHGTREYALWSVAIVLVLLFALIPVLWLISISLKPPSEITDQRFIPASVSFDNYKSLFEGGLDGSPFLRAADQLDRDRPDHHGDRDHPRLLHRLRDRPARIPRQAR